MIKFPMALTFPWKAWFHPKPPAVPGLRTGSDFWAVRRANDTPAAPLRSSGFSRRTWGGLPRVGNDMGCTRYTPISLGKRRNMFGHQIWGKLTLGQS